MSERWGASAPAAIDATFVGLKDLPGGTTQSQGQSISGDGSTVVGNSEVAGGTEAFRWQWGGEMLGLGDLPGGNLASRAFGVSGDGSRVVGRGHNSSNKNEAFLWEIGVGMVGLGDLPGGQAISSATAISDDGTVIAGDGQSDNGQEAFRWVAGSFIALGDLPSGPFESTASGISPDGSTIVGRSQTENENGKESYRYVHPGPLLSLGSFPNSHYNVDNAFDASFDGSVIVGVASYQVSTGSTTYHPHAFRWEGGVMTDLGLPTATATRVEARAVSYDGSTIFGVYGISGSTSNLFIWDAYAGARDLMALARDTYGLTALDGWHSFDTGKSTVSADGRTFTGWGTNPNGSVEAFALRLPDAMGLAATAPVGIPSATNAFDAGAVSSASLDGPFVIVETDGNAGHVTFTASPGELRLLLDIELDTAPGPGGAAPTLADLLDYLTVGNMYKPMTVIVSDPLLSANPDFDVMLVFDADETASASVFAWDFFNFGNASVERIAFGAFETQASEQLPEPATGALLAMLLFDPTRRRYHRTGRR